MVLDRIALILVVIGALNWGIIGLFGLDLVAFICGGQMAVISRVIYALVGLGGLWYRGRRRGVWTAPPLRVKKDGLPPLDNNTESYYNITR